MDSRIRVGLAPTPDTTFLVAIDAGGNEILKARLAPPLQMHPRAAWTLLEGLSLWCRAPLSVVLAVDEEATSSGWSLSGGFGPGHDPGFCEVAVVPRPGHRPPDFAHLRRLCRRGAR